MTVVTLQAQDHKDDKPSKITFIGGWNYAKYVSDAEGYGETDYKSGLFLGINKDVKITPFVWANGGLLYY